MFGYKLEGEDIPKGEVLPIRKGHIIHHSGQNSQHYKSKKHRIFCVVEKSCAIVTLFSLTFEVLTTPNMAHFTHLDVDGMSCVVEDLASL